MRLNESLGKEPKECVVRRKEATWKGVLAGSDEKTKEGWKHTERRERLKDA